MAGTATRLGGPSGVVAALVMIPAYLVGTPDAPESPAEAAAYYDGGSSFITANGVLPLLHVLLALIFVGVLVALLRRAAGPDPAVYVALIGGAVFLALTAAGFAAEVAYPAAIVRFGDVTVTEFTQPLLALATWLYHYCQIGAAALIFATSMVIWRTGALPKWTAAGAILGVLPLLHTWIPLPAAISSLVWIGALGLVMLVLPPKVPAEGIDA